MIALAVASLALAIALGLLSVSLVSRPTVPSRHRVQLRVDREAFRAETQIDWVVSHAVEELLAAARNSAVSTDDHSAHGPLPPLGG